MKSILKFATTVLAFSALAAVSTSALAGPARIELSFGDGYEPPPVYVQPGVIYEAPAPAYRYQDDYGWRQRQWRWREHEWREHEWREHQWREQNAWRERQWQDQRWREHEEHEHEHRHDGHGGWR